MIRKNILLFAIILYIVINPINILAENRISGKYGTYDNAVKIIQEVMRDYYIKEDKLQYNTSRAWFGKYPPEEATNQDNRYLVCSMYTYNAYVEAFGVSSFPASGGSSGIIKSTRDYYNANKNNKEKLDGNFLIYYENTTKNNKEKYIYSKTDVNNVNISDFAKLIQPGDLFTYSGHSMVAYQTVYRNDKKIWDVLILNSSGGSSVPTRNYGTSRIFYHFFPSSYGKNNIIDVDKEGSVKYFWLSDESSRFHKNNVITCTKEECSVIRPFYKGKNGEAVFNYSILASKYQKSELRTKYPGLDIEKTVNKIDNNSVYLNDELEYTITITNRSNTTYNGKNYKKFVIEETFDNSMVEYISSSNAGKIKNNKVVWNISGLTSGKTLELKYKVKVRNNSLNIGKTITSVGEFKENENSIISITTGTVENKVIPTVSKPVKNYKTCYDNNKSSKKGLILINEIYKCAYNLDFHFDTFKFEKLFVKGSISQQNAIRFNTTLSGNELLLKKMILNNLWSGSIELNNNAPDDARNYFLPYWNGADAKTRARNINNEFFKDGDVLIYSIDYSKTGDSLKHTKENGIYAYVYLDGKFVGVNGSGTTKRNDFTYRYYLDNSLDIKKHLFTYYGKLTSKDNKEQILTNANLQTLFDKDYYVILRPEIVIAEEELSKANKGDVNGDGKVSSIDYLLIRKHILKSPLLTGEELKRADANSNGKIDAADYNTIRKLILNI